MKERVRWALDIYIIEMTISYDPPRRVFITSIIAVEDAAGVHKTISLSYSIGQISFIKVVLQTGHDLRHVVMLVKRQRADFIHIGLNLCYVERTCSEPNLGQFTFKDSQQRISTIVDPPMVNPHRSPAIFVITIHETVDKLVPIAFLAIILQCLLKTLNIQRIGIYLHVTEGI